MEELNKNQLILLALLVSFVTSIATGIVTVSLMEQAPQSVTQTINRVVTQTIEKVTKEPATVIRANDDDLIAAAVEKNQGGTVKIKLGEGGDFVGYGIVVSSDGIIATDINTGDFAEESKYFAVFDDGKEFPINVVKIDKSGFTLFKSDFGSDPKNLYKPVFLKLGNSDKVKIGETIIVVSSSGESIQKGIISSIMKDSITEGTASTTEAEQNAETVKSVKLFKLSVTLSKENSGNPLVNLYGEVIGITIYRDGGIRVAIPSNIIKESILSLK